MRRRAFMSLFGGAAAAAFSRGRIAHAQSTRVYRVGVLEPMPPTQNATNLAALRDELRNRGYIEGKNLQIEHRSANGDEGKFPALAADLLGLNVDVIVTRGTPAVQAAQNATKTTPIVMAATGAPLLVASSFHRPGGNVTGMTTFSLELVGKRIELLKELFPDVSRIAMLHSVANPMNPPEWDEAQKAARALNLEILHLDVRNKDDIHSAFEFAAQQRVGALLIGADAVTQTHQAAIVELAARNNLPAIHPSRDFVAIGGLIAYSVDYASLYARAAALVDKIFKGAHPDELPIEQPTRFELVVNLKTARAMGLRIPESFLLRADEVIE